MLLKNGLVYKSGELINSDVLIKDKQCFYVSNLDDDNIIDCSNLLIVPGFVDVHTHLREPGFSYKETIRSGSQAALLGGFTTIHTMANLNPIPDTLENLKIQLGIIEKDSYIKIVPYGSITKGLKGNQLADFKDMAPFVAGFSDDGVGVQSDEILEKAMILAKKLAKPLILHCEDENELIGGCVHDGEYAKKYGLKGISSKSEYQAVATAIQLSEKTGCHIHICHVSSKETVQIIRDAKKRNVSVTCEVTPHHLLLSEIDIEADDGNYKMNPPLRSESDRIELLRGIIDNTIDIIATDHAPHSEEEKSLGLEKSAFGIIGIQHAFQLLYTDLVLENFISLEKLIELMSINPRKIFNYSCFDADFTIIDLNRKDSIQKENIVSLSKNTPFIYRQLKSKIVKVIIDGKIVYREDN